LEKHHYTSLINFDVLTASCNKYKNMNIGRYPSSIHIPAMKPEKKFGHANVSVCRKKTKNVNINR
jgi:hypothetical protein